MMTNGKHRPQRMRGGVGGDFLVWLVAAATAAGFMYVLVREGPTESPGTPEEIAERVKPIGRVVIAAPAEGAAASPQVAAPATDEPTAAGTTQAVAEGEEGDAEQVADRGELVQGPGAAASPAKQPVTKAAEAANVRSVPEPADVTEAPLAPEPKRPAKAPSEPEPADAAQAPPAFQTAWPRPQAQPERAPARIPPWQPQPAYQMIWIQRYDLPGQPFELRPAPPQAR